MAGKIGQKRMEARVYVINLWCEDDDVAMKLTGKVFNTKPEKKYEYQCPVCKRKEVSIEQYPLITYEEK